MPKYFKVVWHSALLHTTSHSYDEWWRPPFWLSQHCCLYWSVHGIINCESVLKQTWITFNYILKNKQKNLQQGILIPSRYQYAAHTLSLNSEEYWVYFLFLYPFHKLNIIHSQGICFPFWIWILAASAMFLVSEFSLYSSECLTTCWQKTRSSPYWCLQYLNTGTSVHIKISTICIPHHLSLK